MFKRTQFMLTSLNSIVFMFLMCVLGGIIYFFTYHQLYENVDTSLQTTIAHLKKDANHNLVDFDLDPRVQVLQWSEDGHLLNKEDYPFRKIDVHFPEKLDTLTEFEEDHYYFRSIATEVRMGNEEIIIQLIRNVDSEKNLLDKLLIILIIGAVIGFVGSIIAGYILAKRALKPIQLAWQKQQRFVADASHELRTPLTIMQTKVDLLIRSRTATIEEKITDISSVSKEIRRLSKLVTNLLTLARSDSNQLELNKSTFRIDEVIQEIVETYMEVAKLRGKEIIYENPESIIFYGDKERMHQLLIILLDNGMKYTGKNGVIRVECKQSFNAVTISVKDNGIGMTNEEVSKIFDRFYQSDKARNVAGGTGLGLSIAKWIIDKHKGKVKVESKVGDGTTFSITLPKR